MMDISSKEGRETWVRKYGYLKISALIGNYDDSKDYAGAKDDFISRFIPRTMYGIDMNPVFYRHDGGYSIGGSKEDRWNRDTEMLTECLLFIEHYPNRWYLWSVNWARKGLAQKRALKYFNAVRIGGHNSFTYKS